MIIGVPKEIKDNEARVGITPAGVKALTEAGHKVLVETQAGALSGFPDEEYQNAGAEIVGEAGYVWGKSDMVVKVKEPIEREYVFFREGLVLFTYLHLAPLPALTDKLLESKVIGIAYETVRDRQGTLPLLTPMSEVAGRMSVQVGAAYLEKEHGGRGILLGGVPGVPPAHVTIIGGGVVGTNAAKIALGFGAKVTLIDVNLNRLRELDDIFGGRLYTLASNSYNVAHATQRSRSRHRRSAHPRRHGAQDRHPRHGLPDEEGRGHCRRRHRPGRLRRNRPAHLALQSQLRGRWRRPLLRHQHARRRAPHLHARAHQLNLPLHSAHRQPRRARSPKQDAGFAEGLNTWPGNSPIAASPRARSAHGRLPLKSPLGKTS